MKKNKNTIAIVNFMKKQENNLLAKRLMQEAENFNCEIKIFNNYAFFISYQKDKIDIYYDEKKFNPKDYLAFVPVLSIQENLEDDTFFLDCIKEKNKTMINDPVAIRLAKNKIKSLFVLANAGLPIIPSAVSFGAYKLGPLLKMAKTEDFICKASRGSAGKGVALIKSKMSLISIFEMIATQNIPASSLLFQKFISEAGGKDIRLIVVGNKIVAAMKRSSQGIDFRSNLSGVGKGTSVDKLPDKVKKIAIKAIKTLGLDYGGVDILISKKGPLIIEVNSNPGFKIEQVTGKNIGKEILKHIIKRAKK